MTRGGEPHRRRPHLLRLVLGGSLALALVTVAAVVLVAREHVLSSAINASLGADRALVGQFAASTLHSADLTIGVSAERGAALEGALRSLVAGSGAADAWLVDAGGTQLARASAAGPTSPAAFPGVFSSSPTAALSTAGAPGAPPVLVESFPIITDGDVLGRMMLVRDATPMLAGVDAATRDLATILLSAALLFGAVLVLIYRAADRRLAQQTVQIVEAARHDPVTGLLNHGAVVAELGTVLEDARREAGWIIVAILDIDNFRVFNETHGHDAGDVILRQLAADLRAETPAGALIGRYGPDEFLVIGPPSVAPEIRPTVERFRERLRARAVDLDDTAPLPVTVSAGISSYPEHAAAVSELLAAATRMVVEAKTGGGDRVRIDAPDTGLAADRWHRFDVLQGLVVAIDAKDHYTKAHSEDVARHARFLAQELGLDETFCEMAAAAGLLHDVGKICVPDEILRKPAPLTADERDVVANHTIVGHLIVSALPGMELIATGARHHHERWDGAGYPDGLEGDAIPRLARIIAVADTYSAMRTTRPYRKGLPFDEALARLTDAAGTQLDPVLTERFVTALGRLPDGILPDAEPSERTIWRPRLQVA